MPMIMMACKWKLVLQIIIIKQQMRMKILANDDYQYETKIIIIYKFYL